MKDGIATTCPYCGVGCGLLVRRVGERVEITGDPDHPANRGRLCAKGASLAETLGPEGRLLYPEIRGERVDWDKALSTVARQFAEVVDRHGPEAIAFYVSGQLLTEDYYVANKLMKGFIGSANIDTNSRLCMSSPAAAQQFAFGEDLVPGCYEDLEQADLLLLVGWNAAFTHPVLYRRMAEAKEKNPGKRVVVIDPRRTATCELADLHLQLSPGSDIWLFNGLLEYLKREGRLDWTFLENHVRGFGATLDAVSGLSIPEVARRCDLREADVAAFFRLFATTPRTVTVFSQGINQQVTGVDNCLAILNVHLATGRIGKPGACPFSITGQPNAMGGREVGGLATQLAAHRDFSAANRQQVQAFWQAPRIAARPGLKAVDLFEAVHAGKIKALWIMATNPAVSLPEAERVRSALARCEFVVVSDVVADNDTLRLAHVRLPAAAWGEKDGTVTNSERRISRQRAFLPLPGQARPDWWIISQVAARMGFGQAFAYPGPHTIFREHAALTALSPAGPRLRLDPSIAASREAYDLAGPHQWPAGAARLFGDGRFATDDGRARMKPVAPAPAGEAAGLCLNTGRVRDQWHTMTRTGRVARLFAHTPEPVVSVHPRDAARAGLKEGAWAWVANRLGRIAARVQISAGQRPGEIFVPMHWNDLFAAAGRVGAIIPACCDPTSGQPAFKAARVELDPITPAWQALLLTRHPVTPPAGCLWHRVPVPGGYRLQLAGLAKGTAALPPLVAGRGEWLRLEDPAQGRLRLARLVEGRLEALLFIEPGQGRLPDPTWLASLLDREKLDTADRLALLRGEPPEGAPQGRLICACHGVAEGRIREAIRNGATTVIELQARLNAGTGCGACLPELKRLITETPSAPSPAFCHPQGCDTIDGS
ncbi:MAG: molybdopterin-dependent oxidoreductase [Burkholderiales bacterium]|nr:molybdopterin-dependent oxidoreductase [Burkholderiales bacterium]